MTAVTRTMQVLEGVAGKPLSNAKMLNIVENFIIYRDADGLTPEEKAAKFLDMLKERIIQQTKMGAVTKANEDNTGAVSAASNSATVDLL